MMRRDGLALLVFRDACKRGKARFEQRRDLHGDVGCVGGEQLQRLTRSPANVVAKANLDARLNTESEQIDLDDLIRVLDYSVLQPG